ncbi:MAG: FAD-binding oxidoreductase [Burkholderiaceae bacterium]
MSLPAAIEEWRRLIGASAVLGAADAAQAYGKDTGGASRRIAAALRVPGATIIPDIMRIASRYRVPVYPISTGRNWGYGSALPARDDCVILDLSALTGILDFDSRFGVVTIEPGVTQGMLADFLSREGHPYLVPVTGAGPHCSLVGNALERGYGITPYTDHFGAVTDVEAVLADGSLYRSALREAGAEELARLFKYGIGPYSTGLFSQSGFGIVTRMTIALARRPECVSTFFFNVADHGGLEDIVSRIQTILATLPGIVGGVNLMNQRRVLAMAAPHPTALADADGLIPDAVLERLGRQYRVSAWTGLGTLYGSERVVAAARKEIARALSGAVSRLSFITPGKAAFLAGAVSMLPGKLGAGLARKVRMLAGGLELVNGTPNQTALPLAYWRSAKAENPAVRSPALDGCGLIWYAPLVPMRGADARAFVDMVTGITTRHGIEPLITFTSVSDRLFDSTVPLLFDRADPKAVDAARVCYDELLQAGRAMGVFPYRLGVDAMPLLCELAGDAHRFHARLKRGIDPLDLISPGRYA